MTALCLILVFVAASVPPVFGVQNQQSNNWSALNNHLNEEIAVKTKNQKTLFGVLRSLSDNELKLQVVKKEYSNEVSINRAEIEKIWLAKLRFGRNTTKGAGIGAGAGAGIGLVYVIANRKSGDGQVGIAIPAFALYGAGIGAVIGFLSRKKHKKEQLIYQN